MMCGQRIEEDFMAAIHVREAFEASTRTIDDRPVRIERDSLGEVAVPTDAYCG